MRAHGAAGDQASLDQEMRIVAHDFAVFAGARFGFVGIDDEVVRPLAQRLGHERPLQTGREAGAATPAQARSLDVVDDCPAALFQNLLGAVPGAARTRALETPVVEPVEIFENAILVTEHFSSIPLQLIRGGVRAYGR